MTYDDIPLKADDHLSALKSHLLLQDQLDPLGFFTNGLA
jgi:hypothetical protein